MSEVRIQYFLFYLFFFIFTYLFFYYFIVLNVTNEMPNFYLIVNDFLPSFPYSFVER